MDRMFLGKCRYCGSDIPYQEGQILVKCRHCGETLAVAEFLNEQLRLEKALKEEENAKKALREAEKERDRTKARLFETVSALEEIGNNQEETKEKLNQLLQSQEIDRQTIQAAMTLLDALQSGQEQGNGLLLNTLLQAMARQQSAEEKLDALKSVADHLTYGQDDIVGLIQELSSCLEGDAADKNRQIAELVAWTQTAHQEDSDYLQGISRAADSVLAELQKAEKKLDAGVAELRIAVSDAEQSVIRFEKAWKQAELNKLAEMYHQAEDLQMERSFDKAGEMYSAIAIQGGKDPEVYWRMVLCHYCVVYQTDNEGKRILTVLYPDLTDPSELKVRKELDESIRTQEQRAYYNAELEKLDNTLDRYRQIRHQVQYDVFISVKQTAWQNGKRYYTTDHKLAALLYRHLTELGLKVFNSEEPACKCPAGQEWEPYILAALLSSKVMIVVGTCAEHMESQWVKNEWTRYQWLQKNEGKTGPDARKLLCYISDSMNPYDIPKGLNPDKQAIVNSAVAFDLLDGELRTVFPKLGTKKEHGFFIRAKKQAEPARAEETLSTVLSNMETWLALGKYDRVREQYEKLVRDGKYLDCSRVHLYALCGQYKTKEISQLADAVPQLLQDPRFTLAQKSARTEEEINEINTLINRKEELERKKAEEKKQRESAKRKPKENPVNKQEEAAAKTKRRRNRKEQEHVASDESDDGQENQPAIIDNKVESHKEEGERKATKKHHKVKWVIIGIAVFLAGIIIVAAVQPYNSKLQAYKKKGNTVTFTYQQTAEGTDNIVISIPTPSWMPASTPTDTPIVEKSISTGDIVSFGHYEQDNDLSNGKEEIEWIVLDVDENTHRALLISRYGLDMRAYNDESRSITWENCTLRSWLNNEFLNVAFTAQEQEGIILTNVDNSNSQGYSGWDTSGGSNTQDRVFLLSYAEANRYFGVENSGQNIKARVALTAYALQGVTLTNNKYLTADGANARYWWLRSSGNFQFYAALVTSGGTLFNGRVDYMAGVRPALWVDLEAEILN